MKLSLFAIVVICFNLLASVIGISMPWIIEFQAKAKFADFGQPDLTESYIGLQTKQKMPEIAVGTTLSLIGVCLGFGLLKRMAWTRKAWLALCLIWVVIPAISQFMAPDLSMPGVAPLLIRMVILVASCSVLFNSAVIREFNPASPS